MLEGFRKYSQSLFLVVLIASVATIFGVSRGPSQGCQQGSINVTYAAKVWGRTLNDADFIASYNTVQSMVPPMLAENPAMAGAARQGALDGLIERELLAHEAERLGMRVTEQQVSDEFTQCHLYASVGVGAEPTLAMSSGRLPLPPSLCTGATGGFDYAVFERNVRRIFRRTVADLRVATEREMLADRMRQAIRASVSVSDEEMWREYQRTHDQMAVKYLRFSAAFYRNLVRDDDAEALTAWMAAHQHDVDEQYTRRRDSLRGLARELRIRHILLRYPDNATDAQKAEVRAKADALATRLAGGEDFVRLARLYSDDDTWRVGGELGWRNYASTEEPLSRALGNAATALQPGGVSPVVVTEAGCSLVQLLGRREGDVPEADAKRDLARTMYRDARAGELAREAAEAAHTRIRGGASIDDVGRELNAAALRAFYRGDVPAAQTVAANVTLAPQERTDLGAPATVESELFSRTGSVAPDVENGDPLLRAAFALTDAQPLSAPLHVGDDYFVLRYKDASRTLSTRAEFGRQRQELLSTTYASMLAARQREAVVQYIARLRQEAEHDGQVRIGNSPRLRAPAAGDESEGN